MLFRNGVRYFGDGNAVGIVSVIGDFDLWSVQILEACAVEHPVAFSLETVNSQMHLTEA